MSADVVSKSALACELRLLEPPATPAPVSEEFRRGVVTAALTMAARAGGLAALAAVVAGAGMHVAFTAHVAAGMLARSEAAELFAAFGIDAADELAGFEQAAEAAGNGIDWPHLAARAGEPVDLEGWRGWALDRVAAVNAMFQPEGR